MQLLFKVFLAFKIFFVALKFRLKETGVEAFPDEQNGGFLALAGVTGLAKLCLVVLTKKKINKKN